MQNCDHTRCRDGRDRDETIRRWNVPAIFVLGGFDAYCLSGHGTALMAQLHVDVK